MKSNYTMDINCFEKSFRDVDVSIDEVNSNFNDLADWQDPNGDKLILGVIGQVCRVEKIKNFSIIKKNYETFKSYPIS